MLSLSDKYQSEIIEILPQDIQKTLIIFRTNVQLDISLVLELQLNKANCFDIRVEAPFMDLDLFITNCIVSSKNIIKGMALILK